MRRRNLGKREDSFLLKKNQKEVLDLIPGDSTKSVMVQNGILKMNRVPIFHYIWATIDPLLGNIPDERIAEFFSIPSVSITNRRKLLGISDFETIDYSLIDILFGFGSDSEISDLFDNIISVEELEKRRKSLGLNFIHQKEPEDIVLKRFDIPDCIILKPRKVLFISHGKVNTVTYTNSDIWNIVVSLLGYVTDLKISEFFHIPLEFIIEKREYKGIEACDKIDYEIFISLLDYGTDEEIHKLFGGIISIDEIMKERKEYEEAE